jgi:hypothetical protein
MALVEDGRGPRRFDCGEEVRMLDEGLISRLSEAKAAAISFAAYVKHLEVEMESGFPSMKYEEDFQAAKEECMVRAWKAAILLLSALQQGGDDVALPGWGGTMQRN